MTDDDIDFKPKVEEEVDKILDKKTISEKSPGDRVRIAHEIKSNPPTPGYMQVDIKPAIYSIDLNTDAHWWFNHVCTVFPLLLDQGIRTHVDIKDSFKPERRLPDFNFIWILILVIGIGVIAYLAMSMFGLFG